MHWVTLGIGLVAALGGLIPGIWLFTNLEQYTVCTDSSKSKTSIALCGAYGEQTSYICWEVHSRLFDENNKFRCAEDHYFDSEEAAEMFQNETRCFQVVPAGKRCGDHNDGYVAGGILLTVYGSVTLYWCVVNLYYHKIAGKQRRTCPITGSEENSENSAIQLAP